MDSEVHFNIANQSVRANKLISSLSSVFLQIYNKFTGKHPCRSVILTVFLGITTFLKNSTGELQVFLQGIINSLCALKD